MAAKASKLAIVSKEDNSYNLKYFLKKKNIAYGEQIMLPLNLQLLDQLKFLLNVFILIPYQTVFTGSAAPFKHVHYMYMPAK